MRETKKESEVNFLTNTQVASKVVRRWVTSPKYDEVKVLEILFGPFGRPFK